jgi:hypothetical protein
MLLLSAHPLLAAEPWIVKDGEHVRFQYHEGQEAVVDRLLAAAPAVRDRQCRLISPCFDGRTTVQVAASEEEFLALQPYRSHIDWASGVAYEELGLIVLRVDQQILLTIEETFEHELSHVLLLNAVKMRPPRWFIEGIAILLADQDLVSRFEAVAAASVSDSTLRLADMDRGFPGAPKLRELAYAQSGLFVAYLDNRFGRQSLSELIIAMSYGMSIESAFPRITGLTLAAAEEQWRKTLSGLGWVLGLTSDWIVWLVATLLMVAAAVLVRVRMRRRKKRMNEPEEPDWEYRDGPG